MNNFWDTHPSATEKYRLATANSKPNVSLVPKVAPCGHRAFAKHVTQYKMCVACWDKR